MEQRGVLTDLQLHHPREALEVLDSLGAESLTVQGVPKSFLYAVAHELLGDTARARSEYEATRPALEAEVKKHSERPAIEAFRRMLLARAYAGLSRKDDALREATRAIELVPLSRDVVVGRGLQIARAAVEGRVGETDAAIEHIRHL